MSKQTGKSKKNTLSRGQDNPPSPDQLVSLPDKLSEQEYEAGATPGIESIAPELQIGILCFGEAGVMLCSQQGSVQFVARSLTERTPCRSACRSNRRLIQPKSTNQISPISPSTTISTTSGENLQVVLPSSRPPG